MKSALADARVIEELVNSMGGVFTTSDLQTALQNKGSNLARRIQPLLNVGILKRFSRGMYITESPDLAVLSQKLAPDSYESLDTAMAKHLLVGPSPKYRFRGVKLGRTRTYEAHGFKVVHVGIDTSLFFGFEINVATGTRCANAEKATLDTLYFHLRGMTYPFDVYSDVNFDNLDRTKIDHYLQQYRNQKFVAFARRVMA